MRAARFRKLERCEPILERPNRPARIGAQRFERLEGWVRIVQRADIAELHCEIGSRLEPSQRKALGATNIRALLVDSAATFCIEERAHTPNVRDARREQ